VAHVALRANIGPVACAGIVLTGGTSRRLGFDKTTVEVGGETLATRAARVLSAVCAPVVEVGPGRSGLPSVREDPPGAGPLAALVAGAAALGGAQVVLLACDLVAVEPPLLRLLAGWPGAPTAVPRVAGRDQLVCARYGADAIATATRLLAAGERSLRALIAAVEADVLTEEHWGAVATEASFADLDVPADLDRLGLEAPE
jgi:molybdopterin-guanine dinucleotide biosynthesis protein A